MSFQVEVDANAASALSEAQSGGTGKFPPILKGEYQATVVPLKEGTRVEVVPFGGSGPNSKKNVLRVAVRIADGSPLGAKRQLFIRVPLFTRYAANEKNPQGAPARLYFDFWSAMGATDEDLVAGRLPEPDAFMGKPLGIVVSDPIEPDKWNPLGSNEVSFVNKAGNVAASPRRANGQILAPWLDANDNIIVGYPFQSPAALELYGAGAGATGGTFAQAPAQTSFGQPQAPATSFGQPGGQVPSFAQQPQAPVPSFGQVAGADATQFAQGGNVVPGHWVQPAASAGLQQAAVAGASY